MVACAAARFTALLLPSESGAGTTTLILGWSIGVKDDWCVHFNGIQNHSCTKGHEYIGFNNGSTYGIVGHLPCIHAPEDLRCADRVFRTAEELAEQERVSAEKLKKFFAAIDADICPRCARAIETYQQVGRCVYVNPCGHRLYQGRVPAGKAQRAARGERP